MYGHADPPSPSADGGPPLPAPAAGGDRRRSSAAVVCRTWAFLSLVVTKYGFSRIWEWRRSRIKLNRAALQDPKQVKVLARRWARFPGEPQRARELQSWRRLGEAAQ
jgi:hypothetical protein